MVRRLNDHYDSATWMVDQLLERHPIWNNRKALDPCNGNGIISNHPGLKGMRTADIDPNLKAENTYDASKVKLWEYYGNNGIDWVITNPPFQSAFKILHNLYFQVNLGVALILRLSFLEPTKEREDFLVSCPPTDLIVLPRYSFTQDGKTDSVTCAWMIWNLRKINYQSINISRRRAKA